MIIGISVVLFGFAISTEVQPQNNNKYFQIEKSGILYNVDYFLTDGYTVLKNINYEEENDIISFDMSGNSDDGKLTILFPNNLATAYVESDAIFDPLVLINSEQVAVTKAYGVDHSELEFDYDSSSEKVEILLSWYS